MWLDSTNVFFIKLQGERYSEVKARFTNRNSLNKKRETLATLMINYRLHEAYNNRLPILVVSLKLKGKPDPRPT